MQVVSVKSVAASLVLLLAALVLVAQSRPMDLYDDVSDFFDAMSLDDIPVSGRAPPENLCKMPARKGVCRALIPRWSYDPKKKDCFEFKFGGCDGNDNNFSSYKQCMNTCKDM